MQFSDTLRLVYNSSDKRRILTDPDYFMEQIATKYNPAYKDDCLLMESAAKCGLGKVIIQYVDQGIMVDDSERSNIITKVAEYCGLSFADAQKAVDYYIYMTGIAADSTKKVITNPVSGRVNKLKKLNIKLFNGSLSSFQKVAIAQLVLSLLHLIILISELGKLSSGVSSAGDPFSAVGNLFALGAAASIMKRHLILFALGTIFSIVGLFMKKPWPYLTSAIIDTVSLVFGLTLLLAAPILLIILIPVIILGYVAYSKAKKETRP